MAKNKFTEECWCIAGGNDDVYGRKSISCSTELYKNEKTGDFRVYFLSHMHQNVHDYEYPEDIVELGSNPKMIFKVNELEKDRTLVGFVFEKDEWTEENYMSKIEFMKRFMGFCSSGIYAGIDVVNNSLNGVEDIDYTEGW